MVLHRARGKTHSQTSDALVESPRRTCRATSNSPRGEPVGGQEHRHRRVRLGGLDDHGDAGLGGRGLVGGVQAEDRVWLPPPAPPIATAQAIGLPERKVGIAVGYPVEYPDEMSTSGSKATGKPPARPNPHGRPNRLCCAATSVHCQPATCGSMRCTHRCLADMLRTRVTTLRALTSSPPCFPGFRSVQPVVRSRWVPASRPTAHPKVRPTPAPQASRRVPPRRTSRLR